MGKVEYLAHRLNTYYYVSDYSDHPRRWREHAWFTVETYVHPYENKREEVTVHVEGLTGDEGQSLLDTLKADGTLRG